VKVFAPSCIGYALLSTPGFIGNFKGIIPDRGRDALIIAPT